MVVCHTSIVQEGGYKENWQRTLWESDKDEATWQLLPKTKEHTNYWPIIVTFMDWRLVCSFWAWKYVVCCTRAGAYYCHTKAQLVPSVTGS